MAGKQHSVVLIEALASVWTAIQHHHPEVPSVVLLPAPAPRGQMNVLGHFAALRWAARRVDTGLLHEVVVVAEHLDRSAEDIIETLLHEAAHALNFSRGIRDCSRSQYHNRKFKAAAEELGLAVTQVRHYGFALTTLPRHTAERYDRQRNHLSSVLIHRRKPPTRRSDTPVPTTGPGATGSAPPKPPASRSRKATCSCGFIIRVSRKTMLDTTIRCDSCGEPFCLD